MKRALGFMNKSQPIVYNTLIGGVSATISTPALLAAKFLNYPSGTAFSASNITNFEIVGSDIKCLISGEYTFIISAFDFTDGYFPNIVTYYYDYDNLAKTTNYYTFQGQSNLTKIKLEGIITLNSRDFTNTNAVEYYFPNLITINSNAFRLCVLGRSFYIPNCTNLGGSVISNGVFDNISSQAKIYCHPSLATNNGGNPDGDLAYAITQGATVRYVTNFTAPSPITTLATGTVYNTAIQVNFTPPSSTNAIDYYECYANGVFKNNITASGGYIKGLTPSTSYNITVIAVDIFYNKSSSNTVTQSTSNGVITDLSVGNVYNTAIQLNFNTGVYNGTGYKVYLSGVYYQTITKSGNYITGLTPSTSYSITVRGVDAIHGEAAVSNTVTQSTANNSWDISTGLVSYYKLDANSNDSYGSNNGTDTSVSYASGKIGNAASFNGSTSYTTIADNSNLSFTNGTNDLPFSISMIVSFASTGDRWLINKRGGATGTDEWQFVYYLGKLSLWCFNYNTSGYILKEYTFTPTLNQYYFLTVTYNGSGNHTGLSIYVNSISVGTSSLSGSYTRMNNGTSPVVIGKAGWFSGLYFNGKIDEVSIYNTKLTQTDIDLIYNGGNGITL